MARPTSQKTVVSRSFSSSDRPIYLCDEAGKIVYANPALADWLGVAEEKLIGLRCGSGGEPCDDLNSWLAVPAHVAASQYHHGIISIRRDNRRLQRNALFVPISGDDDSNQVLVVLEEVNSATSVSDAFDVDVIHQQLLQLRQEWSQTFTLDGIVGVSAAARQIRAQVRLAAQSRCRTVIVGNIGSGRQYISRAIHHARSHGAERLIPLSCDLLDPELLSSTIEDIVRQTAELADDRPGTILLLEVDTLASEAQSALLGLMEIPEFEFDVMSTSQQALLPLAAEGLFRHDLALQLQHVEICIPPLRDRLQDIPLLAQWIVERSDGHARHSGFTPQALEALLRYAWPGEFGELKNVVQAALECSTGPLIAPDDLPMTLALAEQANVLPDVIDEQISLDDFLAEVESEVISRALAQAKGNRAEAARMLQVSRAKLLRRIDQLQVDAP